MRHKYTTLNEKCVRKRIRGKFTKKKRKKSKEKSRRLACIIVFIHQPRIEPPLLPLNFGIYEKLEKKSPKFCRHFASFMLIFFIHIFLYIFFFGGGEWVVDILDAVSRTVQVMARQRVGWSPLLTHQRQTTTFLYPSEWVSVWVGVWVGGQVNKFWVVWRCHWLVFIWFSLSDFNHIHSSFAIPILRRDL